jgi:hypothetical protein
MSDQEPPRPSQPPGWVSPATRLRQAGSPRRPPKTRSLWKKALYIIAAGIALTLIRYLFAVLRDGF